MTRKRRADDHPTHDMGTSMRMYRWPWLIVCATLASVGGTVVLIMSSSVVVLLFLAVVGVVLMLIMVASSPYALSVCARWMRGASTPSTPPPAAWTPGFVCLAPGWTPPQPGPELHRLRTEELCQAWCASYLVLLERSSGTEPTAMLATVEERQRYLDEFERRNAAGLAAWLASGARVASNPLPYLVANRTDCPVLIWKDLT